MKSFIRKKKKLKAPIILLALLLLLGAAFLDSRYRIVTSEYELVYDDLPAAFDGFRIVQISDLHGMEFGSGNSKLLEKVREAAPNIIAITGDLVDSEGQESLAQTFLIGLVGIAPTYYVTGNNEWALDNVYELLDIIEDTGVMVLRNKYTLIEKNGSSIALCGLDDPNGPADMKKPEEVMSNLRSAEGGIFTVILSHRNKSPKYYYPLGAQIVLSGHAHGGLIRLPFTEGLIDASRTWFPEYTSGVYEYEGMNLFVSRGLGNGVMFPRMFLPRLFNNPHLPVIILTKG